MIGGNITDISEQNGLDLITRYWFQDSKKTYDKCGEFIFVGDVHGDMHQFMAPLVRSKLITLTGKLTTVNGVPVPCYNINKGLHVKIIYLGDIVNEWLFSRTIVVMLHDLLDHVPENVYYIYGNHDTSLIGRYHLFTSNKLNLYEDIPTLWTTLKRSLCNVKEIKFVKSKVYYNDNEQDGQTYVHEYLKPMFDALYNIFAKHLGHICLAIEIKGKPYMLTHTTWTIRAVKELIGLDDSRTGSRPSDSDPSQRLPLLPNPPDVSNDIHHIKTSIENVNSIDYAKFAKSVDNVYHTKSRLFISNNSLISSRSLNGIFMNQIVGHSMPNEFRDIGVNVGDATTNNERKQKLKPYQHPNGCLIYYFDFGCSAGYNHDEISRPDYVYSTPSGMFVSNLPGFSFVDINGKDSLLILTNKTVRGDKIQFN